MKRLRILYFFSILILIAGGMIFIKDKRYEMTMEPAKIFEDSTIVFYSSNYKRQYINSSGGELGDLEKLCIEGTDNIKKAAINVSFLKIEESDMDPYSQSKAILEKNLEKGKQYILIDVTRAQSKYGARYNAGEDICCPITIIVSKKSKSYNQSLLFAGRIKAVLDKKYDKLPIRIVESNDGDYNQSMGCIGILVEIGDAANSYLEASKTMKIFCEAIKDIIGVTY